MVFCHIEYIQDLLELTPKNDVLFIIVDWIGRQEDRKSRDTQSNRQVWPWSTEQSRAKANRIFPREWPGQSKHSSKNTRDNTTHGYHQVYNTKIRLIIFFAAKDRESSIQSAKTRLGADCGSDHDLLIAKLRLKLTKVGKTSRPFRYDLSQMPYDYTVEVTNSFKVLDLTERLPEELWREVHNIVQEAVIKTILKKNK